MISAIANRVRQNKNNTHLNNGKKSAPVLLQEQEFFSYKPLFVGDPHIGASKGRTTLLGDKLESETNANTAVWNGTYSRNVSLETALKANSDISFMLSAGDRINKNVDGTDPGNEMEHSGFLWSQALKSEIPASCYDHWTTMPRTAVIRSVSTTQVLLRREKVRPPRKTGISLTVGAPGSLF